MTHPKPNLKPDRAPIVVVCLEIEWVEGVGSRQQGRWTRREGKQAILIQGRYIFRGHSCLPHTAWGSHTAAILPPCLLWLALFFAISYVVPVLAVLGPFLPVSNDRPGPRPGDWSLSPLGLSLSPAILFPIQRKSIEKHRKHMLYSDSPRPFSSSSVPVSPLPPPHQLLERLSM